MECWKHVDVKNAHYLNIIISDEVKNNVLLVSNAVVAFFNIVAKAARCRLVPK